ncbi:MAG: T9SS type A sorting domain-containing protein, partial [candidate division Zixibacteria bacterium]|nr:T9SS type A sorting domain-containing protein [candidate division Zixibacteria bacterium]
DPSSLDGFILHPNSPNPLNSVTSVCVALPESGHVSLEVTDLLGRRVAVLHDGPLADGETCFEWQATVSSGVYFCRARYGDRLRATKMLVIK